MDALNTQSEYGVAQTDLVEHNAVWRRHRKTMNAICDQIELGNYAEAHELWEQDIPQEDQIVLNRAKSKGGWFWPYERTIAVKGMDTSTGWCYGVVGICGATEP